jgi:tripartite-type tricarboxylate transporter receptor subunit TctC
MRFVKSLLGLALLTASSLALAWPTKPVKILVGFPAGSTPDMSARTLADALSKSLGQPVIVENKPGASGNIAADLVAKATDDHTLGVVINGNLTSAKLLNPKLPFDPAKDFTLISEIATAPLVLVTTPDQPSGEAFFKAAREGGAKWNFGSVGNGSVGHLGVELLLSKAGVSGPVHVPYPGNPQVITALLGNQIQMALVPPGLAMAQVRAGKLKAIGISSAGRSTCGTPWSGPHRFLKKRARSWLRLCPKRFARAARALGFFSRAGKPSAARLKHWPIA